MFTPDHLVAIFAKSSNDAFGLKDGLPWRCQIDLAWFKGMVANNVIIGGRKTIETLPRSVLNSATPIVMTRDKNYTTNRAFTATRLREAINYANRKRPGAVKFVIGGSELLNEVLPYCGQAYVTEVLTDVDLNQEGIVMAPKLPENFLQIQQLVLGTGYSGRQSETGAIVRAYEWRGKRKQIA